MLKLYQGGAQTTSLCVITHYLLNFAADLGLSIKPWLHRIPRRSKPNNNIFFTIVFKPLFGTRKKRGIFRPCWRWVNESSAKKTSERMTNECSFQHGLCLSWQTFPNAFPRMPETKRWHSPLHHIQQQKLSKKVQQTSVGQLPNYWACFIQKWQPEFLSTLQQNAF